MTTKSKFWLVWNPLHGAPQKRHDTKASAEAEAERIAHMHRESEIYVLEVCSSYEVPAKVVPTKTIYVDPCFMTPQERKAFAGA